MTTAATRNSHALLPPSKRAGSGCGFSLAIVVFAESNMAIMIRYLNSGENKKKIGKMESGMER